MSILFKGNLEEGNYTLIKTTDGWVLKGETSYVGFNSTDRPQGKWIKPYGDSRFMCSICKGKENVPTCMGKPSVWDYCPNCGARMFVKDMNVPNKEGASDGN